MEMVIKYHEGRPAFQARVEKLLKVKIKGDPVAFVSERVRENPADLQKLIDAGLVSLNERQERTAPTQRKAKVK